MTTRADYSANEWAAITTAPILAAMYVSAAEAGGKLRETLAASRAYASARADDAGPLLRDVLASSPAIDPTARPQDVQEQALPKLREAIRTLERHTDTPEVNTYKRFVYSVAEAVAHAHREGGFLGIGGSDVSEREQAVLDEIAAIFDAPRSTPPPDAAESPTTAFTPEEARQVGEAIGIDWTNAPFELEEFRRGLDVELEHGLRDPSTNVTDDNPIVTGKIALAHLTEVADYYSRLERMMADAARERGER